MEYGISLYLLRPQRLQINSVGSLHETSSIVIWYNFYWRMTTKQYRGRYAIIARMLGTINESGIEGVSKTSIMYKSFLSYAQLKEYLSFRLEKGLIDEFPQQTEASGNEKSLYKITEKGLRLMQISLEIEGLIGAE